MSGSSSPTLPTVPVPVISATGIAVPTYEQYYAYLVGVAQALYGTDINLDPDTQDGQLIGVQALAMSDTANAACAAYYNFSPQTAIGTGLSVMVKINGLLREPQVYSTVNLTLTGVIGATITNGIAEDDLENQWALPPSVTFIGSTTIDVTATAVEPGAIAAAANSIINIATPTAGWYSVTNPAAAAPGNSGEQDGALRIRQSISTELPSQTLADALAGALLTLTGVLDAAVYENATNATDSNGTPAHTIWAVVQGGTISQIGTTIAIEKSMGCGTRGSTNYTYTPPDGQPPITVNYDVPEAVRIVVSITIKALSNYTSPVGVEIQNALAAYVQGIPMKVNIVEWDECIINAKTLTLVNANTADTLTFRIVSLTLAIYGNSLEAADITIPAGSKATLVASDVTLTVT